MTRNALLGVLVAVSLVVAGSSLGIAGAAVGASGPGTAAVASDAGAVTSPAPLAQENTTQENRTENATASVTFGDQRSNGSVVVVNETNLSAGGFVVVLNGSSAVVGNTSYLEPGSHENVTVELDPEMSDAGVLVAVPHRDTDDDRTFDYNATRADEVGPANATDGPYVENGVPGGDTAYVTVGNETVRRATTDGTTEEVTTDGTTTEATKTDALRVAR